MWQHVIMTKNTVLWLEVYLNSTELTLEHCELDSLTLECSCVLGFTARLCLQAAVIV